jgi:transcriptional regulator with XRE-family HTH domain
MKNIFAKRLTEARKAKGINQAEAATALGFNRSTYVNYELGRNQPNLDAVNAMLAFFGVNYEYLMGIDIANVHLNKTGEGAKNRQNVLLNVLPSVHPTGENDTFLADPGVSYGMSAEDARNAFRVAGERLVKAQQAYNRALLALVVRNSQDEADKPG